MSGDYGACQYVDDPAEVWIVTRRVAAKVHTCCECGGAIAKGERRRCGHDPTGRRTGS